MGWPENTEILQRYYPNNVLLTGYDIIPFWVNRMTFQGLHFTNQRPFKDCLIHGLIRDKEGRKMSKSLGNGVDPMEVAEKYGCDSLRFFLSTASAPGMDLRYDEEKVASTWNFINKLWNASRFVLMNLEDFKEEDKTLEHLTIQDKWILSRLNEVILKVRNHMEKYEFNVVGTELYNFIWNDFCSWYIELSKFNNNNTTKTVLFTVLTDILKLLHPFMPYVTEEIYLMLPIHEETIMKSSYPIYQEAYQFEENDMESVMEFIVKVRTYKQENNIPSDAKINYIGKYQELVLNMLKVKEENLTDETSENSVSYNGYTIYYIFDNTKNLEEEKNNLLKEKERLINSIERRKKLLSNENYISKAPQNIVEKEKADLEKEENNLKNILNTLNEKEAK